MKVIGLKNCDTCKKAMRHLNGAGHTAELRDVRDTPLTRDEVADFHDRFGDALLNTRSTTWRGLSEAERSADPVDLILAHPAVMKRPVIVSEAGVTLGWTDAARDLHLGGAH